jgi:predicted AAA+ superfamily ATPase
MPIQSRYFTLTGQHFFLFGPRGTGKTTWLKQTFKDALLINLLDPEPYRQFFSMPERLEKVVSASKETVVVIDEIQRIPGLLPVIHSLIDKGLGHQFILTGSSARKLRRADADLLGGRAVPKKMHPFLAAEIPQEFSLEKALKTGMLPLVWYAADPKAVLDGYSSIYLEQEIKAEAAVRSVESFARFLEALTFSQGNLLNLSSISRECQVRRSTVAGYLEIAQDLLIVRLLPAFSRRASRETSVHPKFYYFDCGVYRSMRPSGPMDRSEEIDGAALETIVYQHLDAWIDNSASDSKLHYWRTNTGLEVDFVIYGTGRFYAIEVKNSSRVRLEDLRGLKAFLHDYPESVPVLLYRGKERYKEGNILCLPVEPFLLNLIPGRPIPL